VEAHVAGLRDELDGRLARAITMLQNGRADMGGHLAQLSHGLAALRTPAGLPGPSLPAGPGG
jgi:hypothetical protein